MKVEKLKAYSRTGIIFANRDTVANITDKINELIDIVNKQQKRIEELEVENESRNRQI